MTAKIGYTPWVEKVYHQTQRNYFGWFDLAHIDIERLDTWKDSTSNYFKCPAHVQYVNNTFVLRCPIDVTITYDKVNKVMMSNLPQESQDAVFRTQWADFDVENGFPIIGFNASYVFVADQPTVIEFLPPYNDVDPAWRLMPGNFNIYYWQRPVLPTFEMLQNTVTLKRGQPLAYLRFRSENLKETFALTKIERTPELEHAVNSCVVVKHFMPNLSWRLQSTMNKLRPKKWLKSKFWF